MKKILDIPAVPNEAQDHFQLLDYFLHSATALRALVFDGVSKGPIGNFGSDFYNGYSLTAFYLFRHSIELAVKALIKETTNEDVRGHDIEKIWNTHISENYKDQYPDEIAKMFRVLEKFKVLKDEQLFRYHASDKGALKTLPVIEDNDFDMLSDAALKIRELFLRAAHVNKSLD